MSTDEQMATLGRLMTERASVRREAALLEQQIKETGAALYRAGSAITPQDTTNIPMESRLPSALKSINEVIAKGGLEGIGKAIAEYQVAVQRIAELTNCLREAGVE